MQPPPGQPHHPYQPHPGHRRPPPKPGLPTWAIVLIVIGAVMFVIMGLLAAIAIPAMTKYMRKAKTAEARIHIARIFDSVSAYHSEHGRCPSDGSPSGHAGLTPAGVNCNDGPGGRCVPSDTPSGPGEYDFAQWTDNTVWTQLNFVVEQGHFFRVDYRWSQTSDGCQFTVQAFGDLDDDGLYSTFERAGAADELGVNAASGLFMDNVME